MLEKCIERIEDSARGRVIHRALIGSGFIAVQLDDLSMGLCANIRHDPGGSCAVFSRAGSIAGAHALDILALSKRTDLISRGLALATVNALASRLFTPTIGDIFDRITVTPGDRIVMVGLIEPVVQMLTGRGCDVAVFEDRKEGLLPLEAPHTMPERIRSADIIILTGTTVANGSVTGILALPNCARAVMILGPSTPMIPTVFTGTGVSFLGGSFIEDPDQAFTLVMEGGGTRHLQRSGAIRKAYLEVA